MEIHIGERVAEVQLVEKEGNQVRIAVDGQMYDVDIVIADNGFVPSSSMDSRTTWRSSVPTTASDTK